VVNWTYLWRIRHDWRRIRRFQRRSLFLRRYSRERQIIRTAAVTERPTWQNRNRNAVVGQIDGHHDVAADLQVRFGNELPRRAPLATRTVAALVPRIAPE
jgi:hypothetical protein